MAYPLLNLIKVILYYYLMDIKLINRQENLKQPIYKQTYNSIK